MRESDKSKKIWRQGGLEHSVLKGKGIDIGPADSPISPEARRFDKEDGDANVITKHVHEDFDYVYSSHCLEHMHDPRKAIAEWWKLVRPNGHLFFAVPDEDLYEQGVFPSRFNPDHKTTFTISKAKSWSPASVNVYDLALSLPNAEIVSLELQDHNYDRSLMTFGPRKKPGVIMRGCIRIFMRLKRSGFRSRMIESIILNYRAIDQTQEEDTLAQMQCIIKKLS